MSVLSDPEIVATGLSFPEGPVALDDGSVLVVEVAAGKLTLVGPGGGVETIAELGGGPNGAAIGPDGALYVCNNGGIRAPRSPGCIQRVDLATGGVEVLYETSDGVPLLAPNDLVFDAAGGFWFTDFGWSRTGRLGAVHYAAADGSRISTVVGELHEPNGIGISPDGSRLYWAQTMLRQVHQRTIVSPGVLVPSAGLSMRAVLAGDELDLGSVLVGLPGTCQLDSLAVEAGGNICIGTLLDPGITVVTPSGHHELVRIPDPFGDTLVTNLCFGGADLCTVHVTLSATGRLLRGRWPRPGLPPLFQRGVAATRPMKEDRDLSTDRGSK